MTTRQKPTNRKRATCPECGAAVFVDNPELDDEVVCEECDSELIVVKLNPLKLDWAYEEDDDDWDDDDDDWDDDEEEEEEDDDSWENDSDWDDD